MKNILRTIILSIFVLVSFGVSAQQYVVDPFMVDSVPVSELMPNNVPGKPNNVPGKEAFKIAKGDTVQILGKLKDFPASGIVKIDGKKYAIRVKACLQFIDEEGVEDPWDTLSADWRTPKGRLYSTLTPYLWIIYLVGGAIVLMLLSLWLKFLKPVALLLVPLAIGYACYLEISAWLALGADMFWWCDNDYYGFWGSVLRLIPFLFVLTVQLGSFLLYDQLLTEKKEDYSATGGLVPMGISFLIVIPILLIVLLILAIFHVSKDVQNITGTCIAIVTIGIGSISTFTLNIKGLGFFKGIWTTMFSAIYIVGAMIAVLGLVIALWHLFVEMVVTLLPWALIVFLLLPGGKTSNSSSDKKEKKYSTSDMIMGLDQLEKNEREKRRKIGLPD